MSREEILQKIEAIILDSFNYQDLTEVTPEMGLFTDIEIDSLDAIDFSVAIFGEFKVKLSPDDFKEIRTVSDLANFIQDKQS